MRVHLDDRPNAWAEVDLTAITANARLLADRAAPARLCAVVKGWGYGHGILPAAEAAVAGGASWLGVALVAEAIELRDNGGRTEPVLLLAEPPAAQLDDVARLDGVRTTLYTSEGISAAAKAVRDVGREVPLPVHLKVDTGMHRVGAAPESVVVLAEQIVQAEELELEGVWTHLAASEDHAHDAYTSRQLATFDSVRAALSERGIRAPIVHAANSGATLAHPRARFDLVRCGIAVYGLAPGAGMREAQGLVPAMTLKARVSFVKRIAAGEPVSYGLRWTAPRETTIATVPLGYYDGVARRLGLVGGEVLIGGRRRPIVGTVTMDQLMVDCGDDDVSAGDEVVLFGTQDGASVSAWDWAEKLDTIAYEIVCAVSVDRVPRRYVR